MTFEQKMEAYKLSNHIADKLIPCCAEGFILNPKTFSILDDCQFLLQYAKLMGRFHFPVNPIEIFSWITENSGIILSGECFLKGWRDNDYYFLVPVLISDSMEACLASTHLNSYPEAA